MTATLTYTLILAVIYVGRRTFAGRNEFFSEKLKG